MIFQLLWSVTFTGWGLGCQQYTKKLGFIIRNKISIALLIDYSAKETCMIVYDTVIIILLIILFYRPENDLSRKSIESLAGNCII